MQAASCSYAVPAQPRARTRTRLGLAASPALPTPAVRRCTLLRPRAKDPSNNSSTPPEDEDVRVEALEAAVRARKGTKAQQAEARRPGGARGSSSSSASQFAEWKEGSLLPEGWDQMDPLEKVSNLYMGQRGFIFWANKLALAAIIGMAGLWVLFRVVGPALGLYQLANDITSPPAF